MKRIRLHGKWATGEHEFTLVDDDMFDQLNAYKWKAKPNGNGTHVYAVRNSTDALARNRDRSRAWRARKTAPTQCTANRVGSS